MPHIILKKSFKATPTGFNVVTEKSFSFHGAVTSTMISAINQKLATIRLTGGSNRLVFALDEFHHYSCQMNHDFHTIHEEDAVVCILDVMEILGWNCKLQYDTETFSDKPNGISSSINSRVLFIFSMNDAC